METQITTIGTILLGVFYAIGYLLNHQSKKHRQDASYVDHFTAEQTEFFSTLSSTASKSTSLNMQLWQRLTSLEELQEASEKEIRLLKAEIQKKEEQITDLEAQVRKLLKQPKPDPH